jgi:AraC family transcriptional activator of mtrCDE
MDVISDILRTFRLNANVYHNAQYCGNWVMNGVQTPTASFHFISHGCCYLHLLEQPSIRLQQGDLLLFPRSQAHIITAEPKLELENKKQDYFTYQQGILPESTGLVCGLLKLEHYKRHPLLDELPAVVVMRHDDISQPWLQPLLTMLNQELLDNSAGSEATIDKLVDVLFIKVIRHYLKKHKSEKGLLAALNDKPLHEALKLMHQDISIAWDLATLANQVGLSRSVFAERFKLVMGDTPIHYLTKWRMQQAYMWLKEENNSVLSASVRCGYQSEASFSKAFKKIMGFGPGQARRRVLAS